MNADDLIAICLYLTNKLRWNFIKISHVLFFGWSNRFDRLFSYF